MSDAHTFFFYDLETSGFSPRSDRIMQFAGQRTNLELELIGEPHNHLIKLSDDILPSVDAILLTGITPQMTLAEGTSEAEFLEVFHKEIATEGTIFVGFNNIRFDDEFLRFINYRNFHDAYEWHWSDNRSRWDMLDVVRTTRALRPDGIKWPFAPDGAPSNRLEELASINKLLHAKAHDALSDVLATIELAKLIRLKQPKLFEHLLNYRDKKLISELVSSKSPFAYTSGKYPSKFLHTTAAAVLGEHPKNRGVFVFDLRYNPEEINKLSISEIVERWRHRCQERPCPHPRMPIKTMQFNRCPAVAPLGVIDEPSAKRISLDMEQVAKNFKRLQETSQELLKKVIDATEELDKAQSTLFVNEQLAEATLYDAFIGNADKKIAHQFIEAAPEEKLTFIDKFKDKRLQSLVPPYISKNYPQKQTDELMAHWEEFRKHKLLDGGEKSRAAVYFARLAARAQDASLTSEQQYILEELQLWGQSILPEA